MLEKFPLCPVGHNKCRQRKRVAETVPTEVEVAADNTDNLLSVYDTFESVEDFLYCDDVRIAVHPCVIDNPHNSLDFAYDTDGIVVECLKLMAIKKGIHFLRLPEFFGHMLDLHFVLQMLDSAVRHANRTDDDVSLMVTLTRFGQKEVEPVSLDFLDMQHVTSISVHAACTVSAKDPKTHLLWSRHGLQDIVGNLWMGGYSASWKAYQMELAFEELVYGHPLSTLDYQLSASLGTCSVNPKSLTHYRGFLGLAPYNSASVGEDPPPLHSWTNDDILKTNIKRVFPLTETFGAAPSLVGAALITVLLEDLYKANFFVPFAGLRSSIVTDGWCMKGSMTIEGLAEQLATQNAFPYPKTFGRARQMAHNAGHDVSRCLLLGIIDHKLKFFPAIKFTDLRNSKRVTWKPNEYVELHSVDSAPSLLAQAASLTGDVCLEIERRGLAYPRTLERYKDHGMPWMETAVMRLPSSMTRTDQLAVLTFVSCVGMLMNNDYISYEELKLLVQDLPIPQSKLQSRLIQGRFLLPKVFGLSVWMLHHSVPHRMAKAQIKTTKVSTKKVIEEPEQEPEDVQIIDENVQIHAAARTRKWLCPEEYTPALPNSSSLCLVEPIWTAPK
ncbi:unnamed protein product [Lota lota]